MLRTTITPENTDVHISVPQRFVGKKVEVLLYTTDEEEPASAVAHTAIDFLNKKY